MTYHPWRTLRALDHVTLHWVDDLPAGVRAMTDGHSTIWMRHTLSQVERRCVLTHELRHLHHGHRGHQHAKAETAVRQETARLLIPDVHQLGDVMAWANDDLEAADELWVSPDVLYTRMKHLHPTERAVVLGRARRH
ncbi:ImmA/IrrE family metallo-endopeptidase [Serinicoccus sediminis]|uniref:ImmA/IrrE family metallo-endopeptidase n=1 Tax=Serinicoccus sediminis TaxID=2306021 RepID=UPI00102060A1|nr:ImmA/IrrE family metallo-endopeptidase [Serinicoccus sediminis]